MNEITIKYEIENDILFLNVEVIKDGKRIEIDANHEGIATTFILYSEDVDINKVAYLNLNRYD